MTSREQPADDKRLLELLLADETCDGVEWTELIKYGEEIMKALIRTGDIFRKCAEKGYGLEHPHPNFNDHDCEQLAWDTVGRAFFPFRSALSDGRWQPELGASIKTYFVGACCRQFPNAYRDWRRRTRNPPGPTVTDEPSTPGPGPEEIAINKQRVDEELKRIKDDDTRAMFVYTAWGYSQDEIAECLGTTPGAVAERLRRYRRKRQREVGEDQEGPQ